MNEDTIKLVAEYAKSGFRKEYPEHWVNAKNFAIRKGVDKNEAKEAALYVVAHAEELGVNVKMVPHGPHLKPAPYFAGSL